MNAPSRPPQTSLTQSELDRIATVLGRLSGIELPFEKISLVQARLSKRLRELKLSSYAEYCSLIEKPGETQERAELLSALTTNVTKFFREMHHFKYIEKNGIDRIKAAVSRGEQVRIWSAACSTGEEPYSIAMTILRNIPGGENQNIKIYATDIDPKVVDIAKAGTYRIHDDGPVSAADLRNFFDAQGDGLFKANRKLRNMIDFSVLNLHADWPARGEYEMIFCRNVVIYFNKERETRIWKKFSNALKPGGTLFIGHSERVDPAANCKLKLDGVTTYISTK